MTAVLKRIVVASYETTDGKTFASKSEAQSHQRDLKRINELDALVKRGMSDGVTTVNDQMAAQIAAFILVYSDELRDILPKRSASAPVEAVARADGDSTIAAGVSTPTPEAPVEVAPVQNGQLPVHPLTVGAVPATAADAELAELMAGLDLQAA